VAAQAGVPQLAASSLKAALDRDWDDPAARDAALAEVLGLLGQVEAFVTGYAGEQTAAAAVATARQVRDHAQMERLDELVIPLVTARAPGLLGLHGVGPDTAALLLIAAGDHPERLRSESSWAHLCGVAPIPASSGKVSRHRLNRGGNREANHALWRIVITRLSSHPATRAYAGRRTKEGLSKKEIIRCLKRYVAREVYRHLRDGG
jgi:transposase